MTPADLPEWLRPLAEAVHGLRAEELTRYPPPPGGGRPAAVLVLFGEGPAGPDLLLIERAASMRSHAGQPAFPGGAADANDAGPAATALREASEEVGLDPTGVEVVALLPELWLPPSGFVVTPVLGWWRRPGPVSVVDAAEVAAVRRVPVTELADPAVRFRVRHPSGYVGSAFAVQQMLVWGFTAGLVDRLLALGGWEQPWDRSRLHDLPPGVLDLAARDHSAAGRPASVTADAATAEAAADAATVVPEERPRPATA